MNTLSNSSSGSTGGSLVSIEEAGHVDGARRWYATYTLPRHEKAVADRMSSQGLQCYLPLYTATRIWNKRRVVVKSPLFPGYVFVRMNIADKVAVLSCMGVIRLVSVNGKAVPLPEGEIERLQLSLSSSKGEPYPYLSAGKHVCIRSGPFAGLKGVILRRQGKMRLIVSLALIQSSIVLDLDAADAQIAS